VNIRRLSLAVRLAVPALAICVGMAAACGKRTPMPPADAGRDGAEDVRSPFTLDIAVTGCDVLDGTQARCSGPAPLVLSFSPVGSPEFTRFSWRFGDGTPVSAERAPVHTYTLPGSYEVTLIGAGDVGNIPSNRPVTVVVAPVGVGRPCDVDVQCGGDLRCACTPGSGCLAAAVRGICSSPCDATPCVPGAVCAQLGGFAPAADGGAERSPWCLGACQTRDDCAPGFVCQPFPSGGQATSAGWVLGCLPLGALGDVGAPCRSATGALDDAICTTGSCADLGALGSCSAVCDGDHGCPELPPPPADAGQKSTTVCARLPDGRQLCLLSCNQAATSSCTRDPLLTCSAPSEGSTGFQADAGADAELCAPKPCSVDSDCAPAGRCGPGARCVKS